MTPEKWQRLKGLLAGGMALAAGERKAYLEREAPSDPELRREAMSLLSSAPRAEGFLSAPALEMARSILDSARQDGTRPMALAAGACVGPYEILALLGAGGMGEVYRARDVRLGREVAVKVLPAELALDPERLSRFEREARAASGLSDPHIVTVFDVGREGQVPYFVSELIVGSTLGRELAGGKLPLSRALDLAAQIASGLAAAHARGIVHRDLKPENVLISTAGVAKIADFGLAKLTDEFRGFGGGGDGSATETADTATGTVLGTAGYMAPEQVQGSGADARTDLFAFGCVLFEMLTGRKAFEGASPMEKLAAILRDDPPRPSSVEPGVPPALDRIVGRCLEKLPDQRFQSARDLAFALASVSPDEQSAASRRKAPKPSSAIQSLAVLPFTNVVGDPQLDYLSDGITEGLIGLLSQAPRLQVMARATVFRYKGADDPRRIGRDLNVDAVLTGSVERRGETLTVSAELVNASRGFRIWGDTHHRSALDVLAVQEDIAREIWVRMKLNIPSEQRQRLARRYTRDKEAHDLYLQGLYQMNRGPVPALTESVALFERAVEKDPGYALGYARISECYTRMGGDRMGMLPASEAYPKASALAARAIELDPTSAEAHAALALIDFVSWKWEEFEAECRTAIRLSPSLSNVHYIYGVGLMFLRRFDESAAELRRALAGDPRSPIINADLGWSFACARRFDAAIAQLKATLEIEPRFVPAMTWLAFVYLAKGDLDRGIPLAEEAVTLSRRAPVHIGILGYAYALAGRTAEAEAVLAEGEQRFRTASGHSGAVFLPLIGLGRTEEALAILETAYEMRASYLSGVDVYSIFDTVREDPRFRRIRDLVMRG